MLAMPDWHKFAYTECNEFANVQGVSGRDLPRPRGTEFMHPLRTGHIFRCAWRQFQQLLSGVPGWNVFFGSGRHQRVHLYKMRNWTVLRRDGGDWSVHMQGMHYGKLC